MKLIFQQDWLGSVPYFYNQKTGKHGSKIWDAIDLNTLSFDNSGLSNYFSFGYSVFGTTAIKEVRFLGANESLWVDAAGKLVINEALDPIETWSAESTSVDDVIDRLRTSVSDWAQKQRERIALPLSGGLDSRLLLWALPNKKAVDTYTYGISKKRYDSTEVLYASEITSRLSVNWEQVSLAGFHDYIDQWDQLYGPSVHAHGMYHLKFYDEINKNQRNNSVPLLSGIFGDVWAGSVKFKLINSAQDCFNLGFTHGVTADPNSLLKNYSNSDDLELFYKKNKDKIQNPQHQIVIVARLKIMLISYLLSAPTQFGFTPWSPFLDPEIVRTMLFLPEKLRLDRIWQKDFLQGEGLGIRHVPKNNEVFNSLDFSESALNPLDPLDCNILGQLINLDYINWINRTIQISHFHNFFHTPLIDFVSRKMSFPKKWADWYSAYSAYLVIYPLQRILERIDKF